VSSRYHHAHSADTPLFTARACGAERRRKKFSFCSCHFSKSMLLVVVVDEPLWRREGKEVGLEALAPRGSASCGSTAMAAWSGGCGAGCEGVDNFFLWIARNPLKSPESDEGIQINPRESKPVSLVLLGLAWVWLGKIWPGARPPITFARLVYEDAPRWAPSPASFYFREKAGNVSPCWRFAVYSS
jgi:hypothetical protein